MKTKDFQKILLNPSQVGAEHLTDLHGLALKYPYFQSAQILLAKAAKESEDSNYEDYLRKAALSSGDRKVLFDLLMSPVIREIVNQFDQEVDDFVPENQTIVQVEITPEVTPEPIFEKESELEEVKIQHIVEIIDENEIPISEPLIELVQPSPVLESDSTNASEESTATDVTEEESLQLKTETDPELKILEREILFKAVYSTIEKEVQEDIREKQEVEIQSQVALDSTNRSPFTAWLLRRAVDTHFIESVAETEKESTDRKTKEKNIINDFITKDPRIPQAKPEQYTTENLGRSSVQEDEAFITETLARVYAKQGKIDKAKKAYQILSLKYPEKSIYFANQLKKLDEQS